MKKIVIFCMIISLLLTASELDFETDFLNSLEEVTKIATKSKLNIDDAPAFITVLNQQKLLNLGVENIYEALGYVPGVQLSMEASGVPIVIFRGITQKAEVKLMIDGVTINNTYRGSIYYYLDFPIELIDRIEVIRGPGSVLYGSNAISGVINVITKNSQTRDTSTVFLGAGSYKSYKGGGNIAYSNETLQLSLDAYYQRGDKNIDGGPDAGGRYGSSNQETEDFSIGLHINSENFKFISRFKHSESGLAYGLGNYFESQKDMDGLHNKSLFAQLQYSNALNNANQFKIALTHNQYAQQINTRFAPISEDVDMLYNSNYEERSQSLDMTLHNSNFNDHQIIFGAEFQYYEAEKTDLEVENHPLLNPENQNWLLVTSARHMPRAMGLFQMAGWDIQAYPVDYRTSPKNTSAFTLSWPGDLSLFSGAVYEFAGLTVSWLRGYSRELFPAPSN